MRWSHTRYLCSSQDYSEQQQQQHHKTRMQMVLQRYRLGQHASLHHYLLNVSKGLRKNGYGHTCVTAPWLEAC